MSETELFQSYESEYFEKSREISQELESAKKLSGGEFISFCNFKNAV